MPVVLGMVADVITPPPQPPKENLRRDPGNNPVQAGYLRVRAVASPTNNDRISLVVPRFPLRSFSEGCSFNQS